MKNLVITGAAGFIGSHFVEHILKNTDWNIAILDKLTYASDGLSRLRDAEVFEQHRHRVNMFACDITQSIPYGINQEIGKVNYIVHMAAETHVDNSISAPFDFVRSNVIGTYQMLQWAMVSKPEKFVYFSTDEVFGPAPEGMAFKEWDRYNSTNPYSATKAAGEELCLAWANTYGIPMVITHTMNNFGERQHPEKFIPLVVRRLLSNEKIYVHGNAAKTKSGSRFYIHARNTADAVLFLLSNPLDSSRNQQGVIRDKFNIVGELEVTNLDLVMTIARLLAKVIGRPVLPNVEIIDFHSSRPGHDLRYALDGSKMKSLGWEPPNSFEESLEKTIRWMVDNKNIRWLLMKGEKEHAQR